MKRRYAFEKTPHISPSCRLVPGGDSHIQGTRDRSEREQGCLLEILKKQKTGKRYQDSVGMASILFSPIRGTNCNNTLTNTDVSCITNLKGTMNVPAVDLSDHVY